MLPADTALERQAQELWVCAVAVHGHVNLPNTCQGSNRMPALGDVDSHQGNLYGLSLSARKQTSLRDASPSRVNTVDPKIGKQVLGA